MSSEKEKVSRCKWCNNPLTLYNYYSPIIVDGKEMCEKCHTEKRKIIDDWILAWRLLTGL